mgnify:CR=1 FL=1
MVKDRTEIPKAVKEHVLDEYRHRCAICGGDKPQLHHIDEDPSNHDPMNLLPLCPNHHLNDLHDKHDPTAKFDVERLKLFRRYKDPTILDHRFAPLWRRCQSFLNSLDLPQDHLSSAANELLDFVSVLKLGRFYRRKIAGFAFGRFQYISLGHPENSRMVTRLREDAAESIRLHRQEIEALIVELLRYQNWLTQDIGQRCT